MTRGEPAVGTRDFALHPCIRLAPCWGRTMKQPFASAAGLRGGGPLLTHGSRRVVQVGGRTMKQPFASAAGLRGGGPILTNGSMTVFRLGSPPPRIVIGQLG